MSRQARPGVLTIAQKAATFSRMATELKGYFTPTQAAEALGVHRATIFRWLNDGIIQPVIIAGERFIHEAEISRVMQLIAEGQLGSKANQSGE